MNDACSPARRSDQGAARSVTVWMPGERRGPTPFDSQPAAAPCAERSSNRQRLKSRTLGMHDDGEARCKRLGHAAKA